MEDLWSSEAESAVLGGLVLDNSRIAEISQSLAPEEFCSEENRLVYLKTLDLYRRGVVIDVVTLRDSLKKELGSGKIKINYLLQICEDVPTSAGIIHHSNIVKQYASRRKKLRAVLRFEQALRNGHSSDDLKVAEQELVKEISIPAPMESDRAGIESWTPIPITQLEEGSSVEWDWEGYTAPGRVTLLTGLWKCGKTTLVCHLLKQKAAGGILAEQTVAPGKVLVVSEESGGDWREHRDDFNLGGNTFLISRPFKGKPSWQQWGLFIDRVTGLINTEKFSLIVLDSLSAHWPVEDENDAGQVMRAVTTFHRWSEAGVSVLLLHHPKKADTSEGRASRGSGALTAFADIIIELRRYRPEDKRDKHRVLQTYSRYQETPSELVVELTEEGYVVVGTKGDASRAERQEVILRLLPEKQPGLTSEAIRVKWTSEEVPKPCLRTLERDLKALYQCGKVNREGEGYKGSPYVYWKANSILASSTPIVLESKSEKLLDKEGANHHGVGIGKIVNTKTTE